MVESGPKLWSLTCFTLSFGLAQLVHDLFIQCRSQLRYSVIPSLCPAELVKDPEYAKTTAENTLKTEKPPAEMGEFPGHTSSALIIS
ncbi:hypothetical protein BKA56DRAFT_592060 [Ilyonectria sp. MPI-CAGE-AT-0026]|nr:hypothetical protein BKA56DRAFT_592060 [Ilyonectria sp. MPI-CAGE-AT-0026]